MNAYHTIQAFIDIDYLPTMRIKNFRKGLLGQFTYFGVIPSAVVVLTIIGISAYLSARTTKRESASFAVSEA